MTTEGRQSTDSGQSTLQAGHSTPQAGHSTQTADDSGGFSTLNFADLRSSSSQSLCPDERTDGLLGKESH